MKQSEFIKTRVATYSKLDACPKCHSDQCTCSSEVPAAPTTTEVAAVDETAKLDGVKTKLLGLIDFTAVDADVAESIKENIRKANKSDLLKMVKDEIEDVSKLSDSEAYVTGLKEVESELATFCGDQKTYSVMSNYDIDLGNETKSIVSKLKGKVNELPEPKDQESGADFFKRCLKWAEKVDVDPESVIYKELVALGKKYKMDVE